MNPDTIVRGIEGLKGRDPVGAALSIGRKRPGGRGVVDNDQFFIVQQRQAQDGTRPLLDSFKPFNSARPELRRRIGGILVHRREVDCFEYQLKNQVGPQGAHPDMRPFCVGDGKVAVRWFGKKSDPGTVDDFRQIECPHDRCQYRQDPGGNRPVPCKPFMRLLFMLRWKDGAEMPTPMVKWQSGSWRTTANVVGFFAHIAEAAAELGIENPSLMGYPFELQLAMETKASKGARFPVVSISGEMEPIEFFYLQRERIRQLTQDVPPPLAITDASLQHPQVVAEDLDSISVPGVIERPAIEGEVFVEEEPAEPTGEPPTDPGEMSDEDRAKIDDFFGEHK